MSRANYLGLVEQALPLRILRYCRKNFEHLVLSYSGGSDSTLLLLYMLKHDVRPDHVVFINTRLEAPETMQYVKLIKDTLWPDLIHVRPQESRKELMLLIDEDWGKARVCDSPHDKHHFRCCNLAKKKPFIDWTKKNGLYNDNTVVLLGIRACEGFQRTRTLLAMIEANHFVVCPPSKRKYNQAYPLNLLSDLGKIKMLERLTKQFNLPMPEKSGCQLCPIYFKFVREDTDRWRENAAYFSNQKQLEPYLNGEMSSR